MNKSIGIGWLMMVSISPCFGLSTDKNVEEEIVLEKVLDSSAEILDDSVDKEIEIDTIENSLPQNDIMVEDKDIREFDDFFMSDFPQDQLTVRMMTEKKSALRLMIMQWLVWCAVKAENSYIKVCSLKDSFLKWIGYEKERIQES